MKKIVLTTMVIIWILSCNAWASGLGVFIDNREVPVRTLIRDGQVFISLEDLSKHFSGQFKLDINAKKLDIYSSPENPGNISPGAEAPKEGIIGEILLKKAEGEEFPVKNVEIKLFAYNKDIPDDISIGQLKKFAAGQSDEYEKTHGLVRQTVTDPGGRFYIVDAPPGDYEITGIYYIVRGKKGRFWRRKLTIKKNEMINLRFDSTNAYEF